ncbi:MogA/MoaB family molybdenum cofactor biosynthesis protein [Aeropyrum camini]|uniref:Molybdopterin biosynthesis protein MogA n=1 Tax=Aeropyrum camini SY1 = JCM 12091 TaxID=1198449 RepID=U3T7N3_9CREN|nr:molybdenum cofactor biosynthesis protein B [Aeropyrum camini]BAN89527.1 molybdopterin biosynthesis protein MogA [Aeropyrum camini SY1 = JCM 12091]
MALNYCLVVTSDRVYAGLKKDEITPLVSSTLESRGRKLVASTVVRNSFEDIVAAVASMAGRRDCDVILVTGGTGPGPRDVTTEVVSRLAVYMLPGYGEEFRRLSAGEVGPRGLLTRSEAYVLPGGKPVFTTPGNPGAVATALKIILGLDTHLVEQLRGVGH